MNFSVLCMFCRIPCAFYNFVIFKRAVFEGNNSTFCNLKSSDFKYIPKHNFLSNKSELSNRVRHGLRIGNFFVICPNIVKF